MRQAHFNGKGTLSTVVAGKEEVRSTRDSEFTDVSPELDGSTAANDLVYIAGTVASAISGSTKASIRTEQLQCAHL